MEQVSSARYAPEGVGVRRVSLLRVADDSSHLNSYVRLLLFTCPLLLLLFACRLVLHVHHVALEAQQAAHVNRLPAAMHTSTGMSID
jgi:hypothetical protein